MSSSSYLGHGAKYWADRYFELQTQTRTPDDSSSIEWREKYLGLEKVAHSTSLKSQIFAPKSNTCDKKLPQSLNSTKAIMLNTGINSIFLS